jgi:hypothetical protein
VLHLKLECVNDDSQYSVKWPPLPRLGCLPFIMQGTLKKMGHAKVAYYWVGPTWGACKHASPTCFACSRWGVFKLCMHVIIPGLERGKLRSLACRAGRVEDRYKFHRSKGREALEVKTSMVLYWPHLLHIFKCQRAPRERLNVRLVTTGFAPGVEICVTTPRPQGALKGDAHTHTILRGKLP